MMMDMMNMMPMYFWKGTDGLTWLFYRWESTTTGQYAGGLIAMFMLGITLEGLTYLRNAVYIKAQLQAIKKTQELNR